MGDIFPPRNYIGPPTYWQSKLLKLRPEDIDAPNNKTFNVIKKISEEAPDILQKFVDNSPIRMSWFTKTGIFFTNVVAFKGPFYLIDFMTLGRGQARDLRYADEVEYLAVSIMAESPDNHKTDDPWSLILNRKYLFDRFERDVVNEIDKIDWQNPMNGYMMDYVEPSSPSIHRPNQQMIA